jgi:hypothetical protein
MHSDIPTDLMTERMEGTYNLMRTLNHSKDLAGVKLKIIGKGCQYQDR